MTLSYAYVCEERRREITQMCTHIHKYKDITNTIYISNRMYIL